jgi:hypothetical protein
MGRAGSLEPDDARTGRVERVQVEPRVGNEVVTELLRRCRACSDRRGNTVERRQREEVNAADDAVRVSVAIGVRQPAG